MEQIRQQNIKEMTDEYLDSLLTDLPSEEEIARQQVLSNRFLRRMNRLVRKAQRRQNIRGRQSPAVKSKPTSLLKKALLVAVIICAILASAFSVYANRETVARFIIHVYEKFSSIVFQQPTAPTEPTSEPDSSSGLSDRLPTSIPQGYKITEQLLLKGYIQIVYTNELGHELIFTKQEKSGLHIGINTEGVDIEEVAIDDIRGLFYANKGQNNLVWEDDDYAYTIIGIITKEEMIDLAISTKLKKEH